MCSKDKGDSAGEAGAAGSSSVGASNDGQPTPLVMHSTATNQSFTLERLMGIYSQLALSIDGSIHSQDDGRTTCSHRADIYCQQLLTTSSSGTRSAAATTHNASVGPSPATVGRYYGDTQLYANVRNSLETRTIKYSVINAIRVGCNPRFERNSPVACIHEFDQAFICVHHYEICRPGSR